MDKLCELCVTTTAREKFTIVFFKSLSYLYRWCVIILYIIVFSRLSIKIKFHLNLILLPIADFENLTTILTILHVVLCTPFHRKINLNLKAF